MRTNPAPWRFVVCVAALLTPLLASAMQPPATTEPRSYAEDPKATLRISFDEWPGSATGEQSEPVHHDQVLLAPAAVGKGARLEATSRLTYPPAALPRTEGLIQFWIRTESPAELRASGKPGVLFRAEGEDTALRLTVDASDRLHLRIRRKNREAEAVSTPVPTLRERMTHVAAAWRNDSLLAVYVDGTLRASSPCPGVGFEPGPTTPLEISPGTASIWDELLVSSDTHHLAYRIQRDYLRTVPLRSIQLDLGPMSLRSDHVLCVGQRKQIGVRGVLNDAGRDKVDLMVFGGGGNYFLEGWDARQLIRFESDRPDVATIDEHGGIQGHQPGVCGITARLGRLTTSANVKVLPRILPDLTVRAIERCASSGDETGERIEPRAPRGGEEVVYYASIRNQGAAPCPPFRYEWRILADPDGDAIANSDTVLSWRPAAFTRTLLPGEEAFVELRAVDPGHPYFLELQLDPEESLEELSRLNNFRSGWSAGRPVHLVVPSSLRTRFDDRFTLAGTLGLEDYLQAHVAWLNTLFARSQYPPVTPHGVRVRLRIDTIEIRKSLERECPRHRSHGEVSRTGKLVLGPSWLSVEESSRLRFDLLHELCHGYLGLPDTFCSAVRRSCVYVVGPDGVRASRPDRLATLSVSPLDGEEFVYHGSVNGPEGSVGTNLPETSDPRRGPTTPGHLMSTYYPRLPAPLAGHADFYRGPTRPDAVDSFTRNVPQQRNRLLVQDIDGQPLSGARIRVFQQTRGPGGCFSGYFPDNAKFRGHTDGQGMWTFPSRTAPTWDDPETDEREGSIKILNPFSAARRPLALTPSIQGVNSILLVEVAIGNRVEYHFLDIDQFHLSFYSGDHRQGTLYIRTNITAEEATRTPGLQKASFRDVEDPESPDRRPVARIDLDSETPLTAREEIVLTATKSHDPDGKPIVGHFWTVRFGDGEAVRSFLPELRLEPREPGPIEVSLVVNDGIRTSPPVTARYEIAR